MRNKEKKLPSSSSVSELILSAVYFLQKKNGVTAKDITKYICHKRGFKQSQMRSKVKEALERGTKNGIFNLKRGLYKVDETCKRKFTNLKKKVKKKNEANKVSKKITQKKVSINKSALEEKKLIPIKEDPEKSTTIKNRAGSYASSEDIFERRGRENSYFEPSVLARPSDEEYDDFDDDEDEDNEDDDEYSDLDEVDNRDIYTFTFADDTSREQFPDFKIFSAARQTRQKRASTRKQGRKKSSNRGKGKKRKISKPRRKKIPEEKNKPKEIESDDDDDYFDEDDSDYSEESEGGESKGRTKFELHYTESSSAENQSNTAEEVKKSNENVEDKEKKEAKENTESKTKDKKKGKQTIVIANKRFKKSKYDSSEENMMDRNQKNRLDKEDQSLSKSECMITSSTKLLPSDFKLSISPNMIVSDVKFSPTNIKFETQDSSTMMLDDTTKNEPTDQDKLFSDFKVFCECQPPKRKNPTNRGDETSTKDAEPTEKRIKSKWPQK